MIKSVLKSVMQIIVIMINGIIKIYYVKVHFVWFHVVVDLVHFDLLKLFNKLVSQLFLLMDGFCLLGKRLDTAALERWPR